MVQVPEDAATWLPPSLQLSIFRRAHVVDIKMLPDEEKVNLIYFRNCSLTLFLSLAGSGSGRWRSG